MKHAAFAVPGSLETPTGGYAYDKRIIAELRALGWHIDVVDLGNSFPNPDPAVRAMALARLLKIPGGRPIVVDGLAYGAMAQEAIELNTRNPIVALVHHPLALETGIDAAAAQALRDSERTALGFARAVIVTSEQTAIILARDYAVPEDRIVVVRPGVDPDAGRKPAKDAVTVHLLAVGAVTPRKGYEHLVQVLASLRHLRWRLTIVGDTTRSADTLVRLDAALARFSLQDRVVLTGAVSEARLAGFYADADVFVLASQFEGYGMVLGEAVAHGLPVVATAVGAAHEIVPVRAGRLVHPGDANALREALAHVIGDKAARERMQQAARQAGDRLPRWPQSARVFARVLEML